MSGLPEPALKPVEPVRRAWWKRWHVPLVVLALVLSVVGWWYWTKSKEERQLRDVYALWDQQGRWRWNDWLADRPVVPDSENGDVIIDQMAKLIPGNLETDLGMLLMDGASYYSPNHVLHDEQILELRGRLKKCEAVFKLFPVYLKCKHSVSSIPLNASPFSILLPNIQSSRSLCNRLGEKFELELSEGKTAEAQQTILMGLQLAHSLDEQPMMIGRLVQIALLNLECSHVQRWLALSEPDDQPLAALQRVLAAFDEQKSWRKTLLVEAGAFDQTVIDMRNSKTNFASLIAFSGNANSWWERAWEKVISMIQS